MAYSYWKLQNAQIDLHDAKARMQTLRRDLKTTSALILRLVATIKHQKAEKIAHARKKREQRKLEKQRRKVRQAEQRRKEAKQIASFRRKWTAAQRAGKPYRETSRGCTVPMPTKGFAFISYKKVYQQTPTERISIVLECLIPANALRYQRNNQGKLRVSRAKVLQTHCDQPVITTAPIYSGYDHNYEWTVGGWHKPRHPFYKGDDDCASGLHFYMTKHEAKVH